MATACSYARCEASTSPVFKRREFDTKPALFENIFDGFPSGSVCLEIFKKEMGIRLRKYGVRFFASLCGFCFAKKVCYYHCFVFLLEDKEFFLPVTVQ
jgi:hypothetical protein